MLEFQQHCDHVNHHDSGLSTTCAEYLPLLLTAIELYRDDFLRGFTLPDDPAFDGGKPSAPIIPGEFERKPSQSRPVLCAKHRQLLPAIEYARRWIAAISWSETAHQELMRLYGLNRNARTLYGNIRSIDARMLKEFGVQAEQQTRELYRRSCAEISALTLQ